VGTVTSLWDVYLDAADAAPVLHAVTTLEHHRAVREPLPFDDADRLLERLAMVASIAEEEAVYWRREAVDRQEEAGGGGGRWGDAEVAGRMTTSAHLLADGSVEVALAAHAAAEHLAGRLRASRVTDPEPPR
jgi:hypothetical protein